MQIISKNVSKTYKIKDGFFKCKKIDVIKDFNYELKQGEIVALMGKASSGKSTLVNLLSGRSLPTFGKIYIDEEVNSKKLKDNCEIITDLHKKKLNVNESVYNNLVSKGLKFKMNNFDIEKRIVDLRDTLELDRIINKKINELNELEKIKVNVAISMIRNPSFLFFDNALISLDSITKNTLLKILKRVNKEYRTTIVIASVDVMDIEKICKRISVIEDGKIKIDGGFEEVKKKHLNNKMVSVIFNKSFNLPKGDFEIVENSEYFLKIKIDFNKCDFATLINQFDINTIIDINISSISL